MLSMFLYYSEALCMVLHSFVSLKLISLSLFGHIRTYQLPSIEEPDPSLKWDSRLPKIIILFVLTKPF